MHAMEGHAYTHTSAVAAWAGSTSCKGVQRHSYIHNYRQTDRQIDRQTDTHTYIQTDRQIDRQTHTHTYIHTDRQTHLQCMRGKVMLTHIPQPSPAAHFALPPPGPGARPTKESRGTHTYIHNDRQTDR